MADFHSLRYTCGTMLAKAGVAPRIAMEIMRHTDMRLTMNLYTDPRILDTSKAIERMPDLDGQPAAERVAARRTGTDDLPVEFFPLMPGQKSIDEKARKSPDSQSGNDPELTHLITAWPNLPEPYQTLSGCTTVACLI